MDNRDPRVRRRQRIGYRDRLGVLVEHHQPGILAHAAQQLATVPAAAKSAVDKHAAFRPRSRIRLGLRVRPCRALAAEVGQQ
ncbi:hypothetical protein G6F22_021957 [Rhizopus arrhizus]|nr:hypothetical protein G6F22_021957 [Rhizopus arrhizus]